MSSKNTEDKVFNSSLTRPGPWIFLYVFFAVLPLLIFLQSYKTYLSSNFENKKEKAVKYYQRELTAFRNRATNHQIFLKRLQGFSENFKQNMPENMDNNRALVENLYGEIPSNSSLIFWDATETSIPGLTRISTSVALTQEETNKFIELLLQAYTDFSSGANLQTLHQARVFTLTNREFLSSISPLTGYNFPATKAFTNRNAITGGEQENSDVFFFWDFINGKDNSQGGFAAIIPRKNLSPTYALSGLIKNDATANPEFSIGYFDTTTKEINLSYEPLKPVARSLIEEYKNSIYNPYRRGDWILFVQPITESSSANIFSIFSIRGIRTRFEASLFTSNMVCLVIALIMAVLFYKAYKTNKVQGLSLRKKMLGLFLLCMLLPVSILIYLGIQFSMSKERLLSIEAETELRSLVKKVDYSALEYYRQLTEWLKTIKNKPAIKNLNKQKLHGMFYDYAKNNQIQNFYLIGINGNIEFDIENLSKEPGNRLFIRELGVKILAHRSGELNNVYGSGIEKISDSFIDMVIRKTRTLHQINWPGSSARKFVFTDVIQTNDGKTLAMVAIIDKKAVDRNYLKAAIINQHKRNPNHELLIINKNDISDNIPKLSPTFKANLLPLLTIARVSNSIETDQISDERNTMLVAMSDGNIINGFLIGARASWVKIVESIRRMYLIVFVGLLFGLAASFILITAMLREFLTPISILSSGAQSVTQGDLDLKLPVFAKDELGELSNIFNFMTRRLRNRLNELTVLYNMTQKASTSHNQREIFDLAARKLLDHLKGESYGTAWINEGEGEDSTYLAEHHPEEMDEAIRLTIQKSLRAFNTHIENFEKLDKAILAIPLYFEEKKFGAVYVIFSKERFKGHPHFAEDEKSFIETLRHHLSLIIEKQRLFEQAITDGLTKLYVRRFFLANLEKELARSKRYQLEVSILLLDIDHFKEFNDTYGHQAGDFVLKETAQRVVECIRSVDTPGRYGGEEMSVILPQTNIKDAFLVAERIKNTIANAEYTYRDKTMKVTVSIGVTSLHDRQLNIEELIEEADKALYTAKEKGRNQVRIAPEAM
jgi:diguanylate cyclase (GGDEF)-like protein